MTGHRIAYLTGEFPRATDTFIQREIDGLRREGFEVHTFSVRRPSDRAEPGTQRAEFEATTTYLLEQARLSLPSALLAVASSPMTAMRAARLAWRTHRAGTSGSAFQLVYLVEAIVLARELRQRGVQHLHNHFGDSSCTVAMLTSAISGIPYSFTLHGPGIFFEPHTWHLGAKLDNAAFCATISNFARSQAAIFASAETMPRVHIVHCGVEPERLKAVQHSGQGQRLIFVGRLVDLKGLGVLLETVAELTPSHPDLSLTVVGDGPDRGSFEEKARQLGVADQVEFAGSRSPDEVGELLAQSDVFVLPSFAEGVPVVIMEALASSVPVVSTFVGGIPELVEDGINGYLVPPGDTVQLGQRLSELLASPDLRNRLGQAGREKVLEHFDSAVESRRLATIITNSLAGKDSPVRPEPLE